MSSVCSEDDQGLDNVGGTEATSPLLGRIKRVVVGGVTRVFSDSDCGDVGVVVCHGGLVRR